MTDFQSDGPSFDPIRNSVRTKAGSGGNNALRLHILINVATVENVPSSGRCDMTARVLSEGRNVSDKMADKVRAEVLSQIHARSLARAIFLASSDPNQSAYGIQPILSYIGRFDGRGLTSSTFGQPEIEVEFADSRGRIQEGLRLAWSSTDGVLDGVLGTQDEVIIETRLVYQGSVVQAETVEPADKVLCRPRDRGFKTLWQIADTTREALFDALKGNTISREGRTDQEVILEYLSRYARHFSAESCWSHPICYTFQLETPEGEPFGDETVFHWREDGQWVSSRGPSTSGTNSHVDLRTSYPSLLPGEQRNASRGSFAESNQQPWYS